MNTPQLFHNQSWNTTADCGLLIAGYGSKIRNPKSANRNSKWTCALLAALLTLISPLTASARHSDSISVFHCAFGDDWDVDYDGWPDRWIRKTGIEYPHYVNIAVQDDETAPAGRSLRIDLDGAAASVSTPTIRVISRFSYVLEAQLKCEALQYSTVTISVDFCDSAGHVLQTAKTEPFTAANGWQTVRIGPVEPRDAATEYAVFNLQVLRGNKGDLQGRVSLADVWLDRLPRIDVTTNNPCNVYTERNGVEIECALSGIRERDPEINFQLLDSANHEIQSERFRLDGQLIVDKTRGGAAKAETDGPNGYEGTKKWQPKIPGFGFYRVVVRMTSSELSDGQVDAEHQLGSRTVDLVVVPPLDMSRQGEFGWTLPDGDSPLSFQDLSRLLPQVGINWVKTPVWFDASDPRRGDELIRFVELLGASNIDVVGIVDKPPAKTSDRSRIPRDTTIADVLLQDSATWSAALEPVMSRLALRVRWWQLGRDYDNSLINMPDLNKRITELRTALFRFGQDVRMGMCADWENAELYTGNVSWDFLQAGLQTSVSEKKFNDLLAKPRVNSAQRWILVDPPAQTNFLPQPSASDIAICGPPSWMSAGSTLYLPAWICSGQETPQKIAAARTARATAFVHRLIAAKLHGADAIIIPRPFDDENGLMSAAGMPAELLLPWRTTAAMLGGAQYIGQLRLPSRSENCVFLRPDGQVVMVAWNKRPTREVLYLGNKVRTFDIMGCSQPALLQGQEQAIDIGPTPTFVLGLNEAIARWRMNVKFEKTGIPSIFSRPHHNSLTFKNFFPQGVGGSVKIVVLQEQEARAATTPKDAAAVTGFALDRWTIEPPQTAFQLAADAEMRFPFDIKLKNALFGRQPIRIDFTVEADERLEFSVYGEMEVGTEDLTLDVRSHLDKEGTLIVEQLMTNRTKQLADFKCHLRSKGHQPQRMQVYRLGREPDRKVYRIPDGRDLIGKELLLEIEELNGPRILNYRFVASEQIKVAEEASGENTTKSDDAKKAESNDVPRPLATLGS
jgi:hypothetical protein